MREILIILNIFYIYKIYKRETSINLNTKIEIF